MRGLKNSRVVGVPLITLMANAQLAARAPPTARRLSS